MAYYAYEWQPRGTGNLEEIAKAEGALSQYAPPDGQMPSGQIPLDAFPEIGRLWTEGEGIALPYCWFSAIDTWDNPSLCAVDKYDLSGDHVRFFGSDVNRPDLLPVARAIQYAQAHDYPAVRAYCASDEIAQALIRDVPPYVFAGELDVSLAGESRESVELGEDTTYHFEVEKAGDRWLVAAFATK